MLAVIINLPRPHYACPTGTFIRGHYVSVKVIEYAMDHLPHLVAEVSRNVDYGQLSDRNKTAEATQESKKKDAPKDNTASVADAKATGKDGAKPTSGATVADKSRAKSPSSRPHKRRRRPAKIHFSVGDSVEVVRHREEPDHKASSASTRTLRVRHDQWFNARIIKIYPDVSCVCMFGG